MEAPVSLRQTRDLPLVGSQRSASPFLGLPLRQGAGQQGEGDAGEGDHEDASISINGPWHDRDADLGDDDQSYQPLDPINSDGVDRQLLENVDAERESGRIYLMCSLVVPQQPAEDSGQVGPDETVVAVHDDGVAVGRRRHQPLFPGRSSPAADMRDINAYATCTQPKENTTGVMRIWSPCLDGLKDLPINCAGAFCTVSPPIRSRRENISPGFIHCGPVARANAIYFS